MPPGTSEAVAGPIACHGSGRSSTIRSTSVSSPPPSSATPSLVPGGILCCYLPTVPKVQQTVEAMRRGGFSLLSTFEGLLRTWNVDGQSVRPDHRMVAHTGFIVTGRKLAG